MPVIACGINFKTAPVALRERLVFEQDRLALYLQDLMSAGEVHEAVLLSTCNRSELYCDSRADTADLLKWFASQHGLSPAELQDVMYFHQGMPAVEHIMRVACGLDSMVVGESQILGQMKAAFSESCAAGAVGPLFNRLFQQVFSVAKAVRTHTALGACPVSVSSAAVRFVSGTYAGRLSEAAVLTVGAGLTIELVLRHLAPLSPARILLANRNPDNAMALAAQYGARICEIAQLPRVLDAADIVITATGSPQPLITRQMLAGRSRPLLMVDIAVPRDVASEVADLPSVSLYSIDDLRSTLEQGLNTRQHAAEKAHAMITERSSQFIEWMNSVDLVTTTIRGFRLSMESLCSVELARAEKRLQRGDDPRQVMQGFARALLQKILHEPSVQLRQAGIEGRMEMLELARELFAIPEYQPE